MDSREANGRREGWRHATPPPSPQHTTGIVILIIIVALVAIAP